MLSWTSHEICGQRWVLAMELTDQFSFFCLTSLLYSGNHISYICLLNLQTQSCYKKTFFPFLWKISQILDFLMGVDLVTLPAPNDVLSNFLKIFNCSVGTCVFWACSCTITRSTICLVFLSCIINIPAPRKQMVPGQTYANLGGI